MKIKLGGKYKDKITGFVGIATGQAEYISGCNQVLLAPKSSEKGDFVESQWFDEQRLVPVRAKVISLSNEKTPGFDKPAPKR